MKKQPKDIIISFFESAGFDISDIQETYDHELEMTIFSVKSNDGSFFYGHKNDALSSLNHLVQIIYEKNKKENNVSGGSFTVDVNLVQQKHLQELKSKIRIVADRVKSFKTPIKLEPMSSYDRLIVHTFLSKEDDLVTESEGEGFERCVLIKPK